MGGLLEKWKLLKMVNADTRVSAAARRIMIFLLDRENSKTKALFPSHQRIAADSNLHERSVRRGLHSLIDNGYLEILEKGTPGQSTRYKIVWTTLSSFLTILSKKGGQNCPTNPLNNPLNNPLDKIVKNLVKNTNASYKYVKEGKRKKYNSDEMIYQRILKKTGDPLLAEGWLKLRKSWKKDDQVRADKYARHLECLK